MGFISATGAESLSLGYQPVTKAGAALFLSLKRGNRGARGFWREDHAALSSSEALSLSLGMPIVLTESEDVVDALARV
jgi:hypothetical protein